MKRYNITVNGTAYDVTVEETDGSAAPVAAPAAAPAPKKAAAPAVTNGTVIAVLEAMKMENDVVASCDGTIASINVTKGQSVETGTLIATINA